MRHFDLCSRNIAVDQRRFPIGRRCQAIKMGKKLKLVRNLSEEDDGVILKEKSRNFWRTLCDKEVWKWEQ